MLRFKNQPVNLPFLHDKLFTLEWELDDCKWLLIHYDNGQRRKWYRSTERSYRFKRWFVRKSKGQFSNLANIDSPRIVLYLFSWYISWPKKVVIPMQTNRLTLISTDVSLTPNLDFPLLHTIFVKRPTIQTKKVAIALKDMRISSHSNITLQPIPIYYSVPVCNWPISEWIDKGLVNDQNIDIALLNKLSKSTNHA